MNRAYQWRQLAHADIAQLIAPLRYVQLRNGTVK
jgi:hypothetical protein